MRTPQSARLARVAAGLSQKEIADLAGLSRSTVKAREAGYQFTTETTAKIDAALDAALDTAAKRLNEARAVSTAA